MVKHIAKNKIITEENHGGIKGQSTITAISIIHYYATNSLALDNTGVILSTDLSAPYDTFDHDIQFNKLKYYNFENNEHGLLKTITAREVHMYK